MCYQTCPLKTYIYSLFTFTKLHRAWWDAQNDDSARGKHAASKVVLSVAMTCPNSQWHLRHCFILPLWLLWLLTLYKDQITQHRHYILSYMLFLLNRTLYFTPWIMYQLIYILLLSLYHYIFLKSYICVNFTDAKQLTHISTPYIILCIRNGGSDVRHLVTNTKI